MEKQSSQSQQETSERRRGGGARFGGIGEEELARMESLLDDVAELERKGLEQAHQSIDEAARLTKDLVSYGARLSAGWRSVATLTARRAVEMMTASWMA